MRINLGNAWLAALLVTVACGGSDDATTPAAAPPVTPAEVGPTLADLVEIDQVEVLQGTTATIVSEAAKVKKPNAPIIAGRPGLLRVHARPIVKGKKVPALSAELRLQTPGKPDVVRTEGPRDLLAYTPGELSSTFNWELDEAAIEADTRISVTVRDPKAPADPGVAMLGGESLHLDAKTHGTKLRVEFVPVRYDADGSGRLSPLDEKSVEAYKRALYKLYPVREVEVRVRSEQLPWSMPVEARGTGWNQLLSAMMGLRRSDAVEDDVYYVGIFAPAPSIKEYCKRGCILGVAPNTFFNDVGLRTSMVVAFDDARAADGTLAQELAHAMNRAHAPCGVSEFVDEKYPYPDAAIGVPGWDIVKKELIDPDSRRFDFMSYCGPVWTSDWTFAGIQREMEAVADEKLASERHELDDRPLARTFVVSATGDMALGPQLPVRASMLDDASTTVRYEDAAGKTLAVSRAGWRSTPSTGGGILFASDPPRGAVRVRVDGRAIQPRDLAPRRGERALF